MKKTLLAAGLCLGLLGSFAHAQDEKKSAPAEAKPAPAPTQEQLEAKFQKMLTKAYLRGRWSPVDAAGLGPEKQEDKYEIISAAKVKDDQWVINAKMKYGKNEFVMPVPVRVKWSGETPMLIVDKLSMGPDRSYSARVLFFDGMYSGSWNSASGYGGVLYGVVDHEAPAAKTEEKKP
jgi:hypothetical protein